MHHDSLLTSIGLSIFGAAILGFAGTFLRVPLLLAYILTGIVLGPNLGMGWIATSEEIATLSEIGFIFLMFIMGLEINVKAFVQASRAVMINGITQVVGCGVLAYFFFKLVDLPITRGRFDLIYLAIACSISSTLIVVKILSDRFDLNALISRITLGILVFQDLWALVFLAVQPNLLAPHFGVIIFSLMKAGVLIASSFVLSKYVVPRLFGATSQKMELMLILAIAWCFGICVLAIWLGLTASIGALVAGVALATSPYHFDIASKVSSLRDFFITLFFVTLGLQVPRPTSDVILLAGLISGFIIISRLLTVFPVLYFLNFGNRAGILTSINLSQFSEFSIVLGALGVSYGHLSHDHFSAYILAMGVTALASSVMIPFSHKIFQKVNPFVEFIGFKDRLARPIHDAPAENPPQIILLGFFREASSLLQVILNRHSPGASVRDLMVVDFNAEAHHKMRKLGVRCQYADLGHIDTLKNLPLATANILICTVPDYMLKGVTNLSLLQTLSRMAPQAKIIVTADTLSAAKNMYEQGATYVFLPRLVSAHYLADVIERINTDQRNTIRSSATAFLEKWEEILP